MTSVGAFTNRYALMYALKPTHGGNSICRSLQTFAHMSGTGVTLVFITKLVTILFST